MGRLATVLVAALVVGVCAPRVAGAEDCGTITTAGCCDGATLKFCQANGQLAKVNCDALGDPACGWYGPLTQYMCGQSASAPVPPAFPKDCPGAPSACMPDCTGKQCGNDGCGGTCGTCAVGATCDDKSGTCIASDQQPCGGIPGAGCCDGPVAKRCHIDGTIVVFNCQGSHGTCAYDKSSTFTNWCTATPPADQSGYLQCPGAAACTPKCDGKTCGDDGCGGTCGTCAVGQKCDTGSNQCVCQPDCVNKTCGDDGCGGSCGACGAGQTCDPGLFMCVCQPDCVNKACGPDGCGGVCGACGDGQSCTSSGQCVAGACGDIPFAGCCDGTKLRNCTYFEELNEFDCASEGLYCAWSKNNAGYTCLAKDTGGDPSGKHPKACPGQCAADCKGKACGSDGCGGSCGTCGSGLVCSAQQTCVKPACTPQCDGKACGPDGCGGTCGTCSNGQKCSAGKCLADPCNGIPSVTGCCDGNTYKYCNAQSEIVSFSCSAYGWKCTWMVADGGYGCGTFDVGADPSGQQPKVCPGAACASDCVDKQCGGDGCGGSCGACPTGQTCLDTGKCCVPQCNGKACGPDGCGGFCGECGPNSKCVLATGQCQCTPDCAGRTCGPDGCGGSCGACAANTECNYATGQCLCVKQCSGKVCGPDGCGGVCGTCAAGQGCGAGGQCVALCTPDCAGKSCGDDGCGGSCGTCAKGAYCDGKSGTCFDNLCPDTPSAGCCVGDVMKLCKTNGLAVSNCAATGLVCGWAADAGVYACVGQGDSVDPSGKHLRTCPGTKACQKDCSGKACGPDGCGGFCGQCGIGQKCDAPTHTCVPDPCQTIPKAGCCKGNSWVRCTGGEVYQTPCSVFGPDETCGWQGNSTYGCFGDGKSDPSGATAKECPANACVPDCNGKKCGPDGCGGTCWPGCPSGWTCEPGGKSCKAPCVPNCLGKSCGSDGCGGTCGKPCPVGQECNQQYGWCMYVDECKGVDYFAGCCDGNTVKRCHTPAVLQSSSCDGKGSCGWNGEQYACSTDGGADPSGKHPWACPGAAACQPKCAGKTCGPDGCGGSCGTCGQQGEVCNQQTGMCEAACGGIPYEGCCEGEQLRVCTKAGGTAKDVAYISCGSLPACGWNANAKAYSCGTSGGADPKNLSLKPCPKPPCTPQCSGKVCGADGCGGTCGTCPDGKACFDKTGQCVTSATAQACGAVKWEGQCSGAKVEFCANGALVAQTCQAPAPLCGWNDALQAYACGDTGKADPSGTVAKDAPGAQGPCVPQCKGKQCGADGCGGSCGGCAKGAICKADGQCGAPTNTYVQPDAGCCEGNDILVSFSPWGGISSGKCSTWDGGDDCAFSPFQGKYVCGTIGQAGYVSEDPSGKKPRACPACAPKFEASDGPCTFDGCGRQFGVCPGGQSCNYQTGFCKADNQGSCAGWGYGNLCGQFVEAWTCQCDAGCTTRGDCCGNFDSYCGKALLASAECGNKTCESGQGETCLTCSQDCGACKSGQGFAPPWNAPYAQTEALPGTPAAHAEYVVDPLDQVLPSAPPYALDGLLAYLPRHEVNAGPPAAQILPGLVPGQIGSVKYADGRQGTGFSFVGGFGLDGKALPSWGTLRLRPGRDLPRAPSYKDGVTGGFSLAFWFRVPTSAPDVPNPLVRLRGAGFADTEVCVWSRPQDSAVTVQCPQEPGAPPRQIVDVQAYYGSVANPLPPDGTCAEIDALGPNHQCHFGGVQELVEKACLGKTSCHPNPWDVAKDPCSPPPHVPNLSTLVVRAVCDYQPSAYGASLLVEDGVGNSRLRYEVGGLPPLRGTTNVKTGKWQHVAVTFHPYGPGRLQGVTTLFVDGQLQASTGELDQPDVRELVFGLGVAPAGSGLVNASGTNLAAIADMDEVFVYDRALTEGEIRALVEKPERKLLRLWPAMAPARVAQTGTWTSGGKATAVPVEAPHLLDAGATSAAGKDVPFRASYQALGLPAGVQFRAAQADGDVADLSTFTLAGWVRVAQPAAGKTLMRLDLAGKPQITVALTADCGGKGVTGFGADGTKTPVTNCEHGLAAGEWAFVALTRFAGWQTLFVDGHEVGAVKVGEDALFQAPSSQERAFQTGDGVDLLWAGLFDYVSAYDLPRWRSQGPAVWLDGGSYKTGTATRLRDFANFHNNAASGATDGAAAWNFDGQPSALAESNGPLLLQGGGDSAKILHVTVPARGRFGGVNGSYLRRFTWSGRVHLTQADVKPIPLVAQELTTGGVTSHYFTSHLVCTRKAPGGLPDLTCRVEAVGLRQDGKYVKWATADRVAPLKTANMAWNHNGDLGLVLDMDVAVAFDGWAPTVAFGTDDLAAGPVAHMPGQVVTVTATPNAPTTADLTSYEPAPLEGMYFAMRPPGIGSGNSSRFANVRLYPRVLAKVELQRLVRGDCGTLDCAGSGHTCVEGGSVALASCAGCGDAYLEAASALGGQCIARRAFFAACSHDAQCGSGLCAYGRCAVTTGDGTCKATCAGLGRDCVKKSDWSDVWSCSDTCLPYYEPPLDFSNTGPCTWNPETPFGEVCSADAQCLAGVCHTTVEPTYTASFNRKPDCQAGHCPVWTTADGKQALQCGKGPKYNPPYDSLNGTFYQGAVCPPVPSGAAVLDKVKRCASLDVDTCKAEHRDPVVHKGTGLVQSYVTCDACDPTTYAGKPIWVKGWRLLHPEACETILENLVHRWWAGKANWYDLDNEPSLDLLGQFLLDKDTTLTPEDVAKMETLGVGPEMMAYIRGDEAHKQSIRSKYGRLLLADCANTGFDKPLQYGQMVTDPKTGETTYQTSIHYPSPYFDANFNKLGCVANKFPNGTPCPPPGANVPQEQGDDFCESGFCARDTRTCETGYGRIEVNEDASRGDDKQPEGGGSDFGPFSLTQQNDTVLQVRKPKPPAAAAVTQPKHERHYDISAGNAHGLSMFGAEQSEIFNLEIKMSADVEAGEAKYDPAVFLFGIKVPQTGKPYTGCPQQTWENNSYKKPPPEDAKCKRLTDPKELVPAVPTAKLCLPSPGGCGEPKEVPSFAAKKKTVAKGPLCLKKTTFAGPIPITVEASVTIDVCFGVGTVIDDQTFEPAFQVLPEVGVTAGVKGGVGGELGPIEAFAGVRAAITIVNFAFPIRWALVIANATDKLTQQPVTNLYEIRYYRKVLAEITVLKLALSIFAEVGLGPLKTEWEQQIFGWDGLKFSWDLAESTIKKTKLDLQHVTADQADKK